MKGLVIKLDGIRGGKRTEKFVEVKGYSDSDYAKDLQIEEELAALEFLSTRLQKVLRVRCRKVSYCRSQNLNRSQRQNAFKKCYLLRKLLNQLL
jgi:hypothetical protein